MSNPNPSPKTRFKEGISGNPAGRPEGRFSITSLIIKQLESNTKQAKEIIQWLMKNRKDLVWQMIDPKPQTDINLGGELPFQIIEIGKLDKKDGGEQKAN